MAKMVSGTQQQGKRRFQGIGVRGKWDPQPGSPQFYMANMPERFNNTLINIKTGLEGINHPKAGDRRFLEMATARVLSWNEKNLAMISFPLPDKCFACGGDLVHKD